MLIIHTCYCINDRICNNHHLYALIYAYIGLLLCSIGYLSKYTDTHPPLFMERVESGGYPLTRLLNIIALFIFRYFHNHNSYPVYDYHTLVDE